MRKKPRKATAAQLRERRAALDRLRELAEENPDAFTPARLRELMDRLEEEKTMDEDPEKKTEKPKRVDILLRLDPEIAARVDGYRKQLQRENPALRVARSDAIRKLLIDRLDDLMKASQK